MTNLETKLTTAAYPLHRRVFGWLISQTPSVVFTEIDRPNPAHLARKVSSYVALAPGNPMYQTQATFRSITENPYEAIEKGVRDINDLVQLTQKSHESELRNMPRINRDRFALYLAQIARLPDYETSTYFHVLRKSAERRGISEKLLDVDPYKLIDEDPIELENKHCPFVTTAGEMDPLFKNFVVWGTELVLLSWDAHDLSTVTE